MFFTVLVVAGAGYALAAVPIQLGLDLRGGTQIVLEAEDTPEVEVDADVMERTLEVLRRRVDAFGVAEPTLQVSGERRIIVELPGLDDPDEAVELIGRTAQLTFHPVVDSFPAGSVPEDAEGLVLPGGPGEDLLLGPVEVSGSEVVNAAGLFDPQGAAQWIVTIDFQSEGGDAWAEMTARAACAAPTDPARRVAIVLDETVISSPGVSPSVQCGVGITGGGTVITGGFDEEEARDLALLIRAGALPVPVEVIERGTIGPSLGESAVAASIQATIIGATLTILYMIGFYRVMGVVVALSLVIYGAISYAVLALMGATLTLPGIAGFVLAIGMAVDANVLVYERAKEEHAEGSSVIDSIQAGFARAWSAIADANMTTLLAAVLLFFFASGAVRGFGITLTVGVIVSMFTALVVTRVMLEVLTRFAWFRDRPALMGMTVGRRFQHWLRTAGPDLLGNWRRWLIVSLIAMIIALGGLVNGINFGLEFLGGRLVEYSTAQDVDLDELRSALADGGIPRALIQESGQGTIVIRTEQLDADEEQGLEEIVTAVAGETTLVRDQFVGPTLGDELRTRALMALGIALLLQLGYLAIRFRWTIGLASVIAMFHDVAILIGIFAWLGKTFDGVFLASLLTVIGYSLNDSVVIFDRIREQRRARPDDPIQQIANDSCLQTLPRTINTGMGALLILVALYLLGGDTLSDFALALLIGILVGTYSSVFTASPIAIELETRYPPPPPKEEEGERPGVPRGRSSRS